MSSLISEQRLQRAQDEYFKKLEEHYQRERQDKEQMKKQTIAMCVRIQLWWKEKLEKRSLDQQLLTRVRRLLAGFKILFWLKKRSKLRRVREKFALQSHSITNRKYSKQQIARIVFLQAFISARYQKNKQFMSFLIRKKVAAKVQQKHLVENLLTKLNIHVAETFKKHAATISAFDTEIEFIENTLAYNEFNYYAKWDEYQESLSRFMKGRNKNEDYIEQKTPLGARIWTNIKTMEQTTVNPIERCLEANIAQIKATTYNEFIQKNEYLEIARKDLQVAKGEFSNNYLSILQNSF